MEERQRLIERPSGEVPEGLRLAQVVATCPGNAEVVVERARQVMEVVLGHVAGPWPPLSEWREALPDWFVAACVDDAAIRTCAPDRWSLRAWLHWLQPDNRRWYWWDAEVEDASTLRIRVLVRTPEYLRGSLEWLLRASGAVGATRASPS